MRWGWVEAVVLVTAVVLVMLARRAPTRWFPRLGLGVRRVGHWLVAWARSNPATATLWTIVALHAWMLAGLPEWLRRAVLRTHSTNLSGLWHDPLGVLVTSALWTDVDDLVFVTVLALLVLAPAERWLGTGRALLVFLLGHVVATLITAVWLAVHIRYGLLPIKVARTVDVGVSYGAFCVAAVLCYRLRMRYRLPAVAALGGLFTYAVLRYHTFTDIGHLVSFLLGLALYPVTRSAAVRARRAGPWIAPIEGDNASTADRRDGSDRAGHRADGGADRRVAGVRA